ILASVDELAIFIEQEKIGRAGGLVSLGHFLALINEISKTVAGELNFFRHVVRTIAGMIFRVVGIDGNDGGSALLILFREVCKRRANMLHVRAVIADKGDEQGRRIVEIVYGNYFAGGIAQAKFRSFGAEREHSRSRLNHAGILPPMNAYAKQR